MERRTVIESRISCPSRLFRAGLLGLLLTGVLVSGPACQSPTRGAGPPAGILQPEREIHGMVNGPDGQPIAGAVVTAYDGQPKYLFAPDVLRERGRQTTGADGAFRFHVGHDAQRVYFVVRKSGFGTGLSAWWAGQQDAPVVVHMAPPADLVGRVLDHQRKPVAGATVSVCNGVRFQDFVSIGLWVPSLAARTDEQGRFRIQGLPAGEGMNLSVTAPGHGRLDTIYSQENGYVPGPASVDLQMSPSATVEVITVSKQTGKPVKDVPLILACRGLAAEVPGTPVAGLPGHVRWTDLPPGGGVVFVATPYKGVCDWAGIRQGVEAKVGTPDPVKIELVRGQIVEIRVRDARTGKPVKHYYTGLSSPEPKCSAIGMGGRDGVAQLRVVPGEFPYLWVYGQRHREYRRQEPLKVQPGKPLRIDVALEPSGAYLGTVVDPDGRPVPGAAVAVLGQMAGTVTDAKGTFELYPSFFQTDRTPTVTVVARLATSNLAAAVEVPAPDKPLKMCLKPAATYKVTVVDPDGKPIAGANVTLVLGHCDARPDGGRFQAYTDQAGQCIIRGVPVSCPLSLCVQAASYVAQAQLLPAPAPPFDTPSAYRFQLHKSQYLSAGPAVKEIPVPATPLEDAIWGATGRDSRGHVWFAVSKANRPGASADLFELVPDSGQVIDHGNVCEELKKAGMLRPDEQQMKIHSKIYEVDGCLYFVSMDEKGEDEQKLAQPVFGGHLWRFHLADGTWEHLLTIPEAMVGLAVGGGKVYTLGYWGHVLYQYDIATGAARHIKVGACFGHVSRNLIADARGHVYVPRCATAGGLLQADLVEFDDQLREVGSSPLPLYYNGTANWSYGITALQPLPDGRIAFLTHNGWLTIIRPHENGPAELEHVGWFHPDGPRMADSLFVDKTGHVLMGAVMGPQRLCDWVSYDLATGQRTVAPLSDGDPLQPSWGLAFLGGCQTRDDQGRCYVVGQGHSLDRQSNRPVLLQVDPAAPHAAAQDVAESN
jgi:protocatechuate 3,4-dioxygenase beta subunit